MHTRTHTYTCTYLCDLALGKKLLSIDARVLLKKYLYIICCRAGSSNSTPADLTRNPQFVRQAETNYYTYNVYSRARVCIIFIIEKIHTYQKTTKIGIIIHEKLIFQTDDNYFNMMYSCSHSETLYVYTDDVCSSPYI